MPKIKEGSTYRHFKGKLYMVITIARHTETEEELVVYKSLETGKVWARPLDMFKEQVLVNGQNYPRFKETDEVF